MGTFKKLVRHNSMGPCGMHQRVVGCLCEAAVNYLGKAMVIEGVFLRRKRANVTPGFKKGKNNPSNCRQASLP